MWHRAIEHLKRKGGGRSGANSRLLKAALDAENALHTYCCHQRMAAKRKGWR